MLPGISASHGAVSSGACCVLAARGGMITGYPADEPTDRSCDHRPRANFILRLRLTRVPPDSRGGTCPWHFPAAKLVLPEKKHSSFIKFLTPTITCGPDPWRSRPASSCNIPSHPPFSIPRCVPTRLGTSRRRPAAFGFTGHRPPATLPSRSAIARARLSPRLLLRTLALFPPLRPGRFWLKFLRFHGLLRFQIGFVWRFLRRRHVVREALPGAIALSRLACRVRTFVGQDSILVVRRVINDTSGIVSHDRTEHSLCHRLAVLPFIAATRLHLALLIPHLQFAPRHLGLALRCLAFVICHLPSVVRHPTSVIRLFYFSIPHPKIRNPQFPKLFQR